MVFPNLSALLPVFIQSIRFALLGIVVVLFLQCMTALLNPINHTKGGVKWPLVIHTVAMFSFATVDTALNLDLQSICYVDNRNFAGVSNVLLPGPFAYQQFIYSNPINVVSNVMFLLNTCLADGLLVGFIPNSAARVSKISRSYSFIVAG